MLNKYRDFTRKHSELSPKFEWIPLTELQNRFQYVGGQIENGVLYSVVNSAEKMLTYDISKDKISFYGDFSKEDFSL